MEVGNENETAAILGRRDFLRAAMTTTAAVLLPAGAAGAAIAAEHILIEPAELVAEFSGEEELFFMSGEAGECSGAFGEGHDSAFVEFM